GETSEVLEPGHVAITAAGGAGTDLTHVGAGAAGRVRVGIGHDQEVRIEAAALSFESESDHCSFDCDPGEIKHFDLRADSALLSWKIHLPSNAALIIGVGASRHRWASGDANPP